MAAKTVKWQKLDLKDSSGITIRGIEFRDYGKDGRSYRIREMLNGKSYVDSIVGLSLEEILSLRKMLHENRVNGAGPQYYSELLEGKAQTAKVAAIEKEHEEKQIIAKSYRERNNTIEKYYTVTYWPERQKRKGSPDQNRTVDGHFRNWIKPLVGSRTFANFSYRDIDLIIQSMRSKDKTETTIKHVVGTLSNIWNRAMADDLTDRPFPKMKAETIHLDNSKTCFLTEEEQEQLLATLYTWEPSTSLLQQKTLYGYAVLSLYAGLRSSEIKNLTWADVEANKVRKTKNGKTRTAHYDIPEIQEMLDERRSMFPAISATDFVFPEQATNVAISKEFARVVEHLKYNYALHRVGNKMEKIDFHALRHSFASHLAMKGVDLHEIMVLMGHSSISMVLRYATLSPNYTKKAVMKLSRKKELRDIQGNSQRPIVDQNKQKHIVQ